MKCSDGIWFPDSEIHLVDMVQRSSKIDGRGTYQYQKLSSALKYVRHWRCALDIGMHVGLWAMHLTKRFDMVIGFEPVLENIDCLRKNLADTDNYQVHNCALGNKRASVGLKFMNGSTGSTQIDNDGQGVEMLRLDDFVFAAVDFIKIDVENYEPFVVEGGEITIRTHKPVIILEQKSDGGNSKFTYDKEKYAAKKLLESWGAKERFEMHGDHCLSWN